MNTDLLDIIVDAAITRTTKDQGIHQTTNADVITIAQIAAIAIAKTAVITKTIGTTIEITTMVTKTAQKLTQTVDILERLLKMVSTGCKSDLENTAGHHQDVENTTPDPDIKRPRVFCSDLRIESTKD